MIKYAIRSREILDILTRKGYTTTMIRREKLLSESTLQRLRKGDMIDISSIGKICSMIGCQPDMLIKNEITEDEKEVLKTLLKM